MFRVLGLRSLTSLLSRSITALTPGGALGRAVRFATQEVRDYAASISHVITGALRSAQTWRYFARGPRGVVSIRPSVINSFGQRPAKYGIVEHARGGAHAFYDRTVREQGPAIVSRAEEYVGRRIF